ncbi:ribosome biogenesis GTP-binding protein YihA/YsxC [Angelakisella massiliensis]|uniref:ribosome biogenesis GTP-binding protein YihA/YsxC n=1 Tax=Angelakisella massiliensis TaxID=1871018 RepID=UPI0008F8804C|nr:ribosome biogenesis GTP-binding protein YihA/YsxC [Angelakisella massiliensis]
MNFQQVRFETSFGRLDQLPPSQMPELVFAGRSNVGKSSLINKLFSQKSLARVSATPGKTATINFFRGGQMRFVDLPGYGYAKVSRQEKLRWASLIEGYFAQDRDIRLVFSLVDMRHPPTNDDLMMIEFLIESELPFVVVLTKADKLSAAQQRKRLEELEQELPYGDQITVIPFSAVTGLGVEALREIINEIEADRDEDLPPQET